MGQPEPTPDAPVPPASGPGPVGVPAPVSGAGFVPGAVGNPAAGFRTEAADPPTYAMTAVPQVSGPPYVAPAVGVPQSVSAPPDPLFPDVAPSWQPRIVPSPPPQRGKLLIGLLIGLVSGLLVFGVSGFFVGRLTAGESSSPGGVAGPTASPSAGPYEQTLLALNQPKFSGELAAFAEPWLTVIAGCLKDGDTGGPELGRGEATRVFCEYGAMSIYFVQYQSTAERDKARLRNLSHNLDARESTPGVKPGEEGLKTPSGHSTGSYIEYAYKAGSGDKARVVSALWWDDDTAPVGAFLLAYWEDGVGKSWEPMRDVWARHS